MTLQTLQEKASKIHEAAQEIMLDSNEISAISKTLLQKSPQMNLDPFIIGLTVFALACFVGRGFFCNHNFHGIGPCRL